MRLLLPILAYVILAAHLLFQGFGIAAAIAAAVIAPALLFIRGRWAPLLSSTILFLAGIEWLRTVALLVMRRSAEGRPWGLALAILTLCALLSWIAISALRAPKKHA